MLRNAKHVEHATTGGMLLSCEDGTLVVNSLRVDEDGWLGHKSRSLKGLEKSTRHRNWSESDQLEISYPTKADCCTSKLKREELVMNPTHNILMNGSRTFVIHEAS